MALALLYTEVSAARPADTFSPALLRQLKHCLGHIETRYKQDTQFVFDVRRDCQTLAGMLSRNDFAQLIQPPFENNLSVDQLMDLRSLAGSFGPQPADRFGFDFQRLPGILEDTLVLEKEPDVSWWKRFTDWLAELFERNQSKQPDWLKEWLSKLSIPAALVETLYKALVIVLAILLLAVIVIEVRAAGVSRWFKKRSRQKARRGNHRYETQDAQLTWEAIAQLPAREKILTGYNKLLHVLASKNLIPADSSLTNRELQTRLERALGGEQTVFRQLVRGVEATLYGGKPMDGETADTLLRAAAKFAGAAAHHQLAHQPDR